jgi:hypothetical protein
VRSDRDGSSDLLGIFKFGHGPHSPDLTSEERRGLSRMSARPEPDNLPHLGPNEEVGAGLRRAVDDCLKQAVQRRARVPEEKVVHEARRALKRARAILRLAEKFDVGGAKTGRRHLSQLGRELSPLRDQAVVAKTADALICFPDAETRAALAGLRTRTKSNPAQRTAARRWWRAWWRKLESQRRKLARLAWRELAEYDLQHALHHQAKRLKHRARAARKAPRDLQAAHEWRKAAIVLREQVRVLRPVLGAAKADALHVRLHRLSHRLGQAIDHHLVTERISGRTWPVNLRRGLRQLKRASKHERRRALKRAHQSWPKLRRKLRRELGKLG